MGVTIRDGFGQTETAVQVANSPGQLLKAGSMGRPSPGYQVVLLDPVTGEPGAAEGEISLDLSGDPVGLMAGYHGDPERTAEAMAGGFYRTGDIGSRDADGYITYIGRSDDVFKASDYKISPFELESALLEHEAVAEVAVVPAPDPVRLAVPKAYIVLAEGWEPGPDTAKLLFEHSRAVLAPYKRIRRLEFGVLPKTVSGKIRRIELRERTAEGSTAEYVEEICDEPFLRARHRHDSAARRHDRPQSRPGDRGVAGPRGAGRSRHGCSLDVRRIRRCGGPVGARLPRDRCRQGGPGRDLGGQLRGVGARAVRDRPDRRDHGQHQPGVPGARTSSTC